MNFKKYMYVSIGILFCVFYWVIESLIHSFIIDDYNFIENIFTPSIHKIMIGIIVTSLLIILSFNFQLTLNKIKESKRKLKESEKKYREAYNRAEFYKDIVIHDVSNVLQNVHSSVELILSPHNKPEDSMNFDNLIRIIQNSAERGTKLISNVRKLSKLEDAEISLQTTDISHFLKDSITFLRKSFKDREIVVQFDAPEKKFLVRANELLLDVFENILINAAKYNNNSIIHIIVEIFKEKQGDINFVRLEFKDNGIGVHDKIKKAIFQKGFQKDKEVKGMGIGLSLVKKIMNSYNGKIWIEDKVKGEYTKGSNFILLITEAL